MRKCAKQVFFEEAIRRRESIMVYTVDARGAWAVTKVQTRRARWTLSAFGFVQFDLSMRNNAWVQWSSVFHLVAGERHCVDWSRLPKAVLSGWTLQDVMEEYKKRVRAQWFGAVSVGGRPVFVKASVPPTEARPATRTEIRARARGWRVIQGGAA